jgi:hypothetical protein
VTDPTACGLCGSTKGTVNDFGFKCDCGAQTFRGQLAIDGVGDDDLRLYYQEVEAERAEDAAALQDHLAVKRGHPPRGAA